MDNERLVIIIISICAFLMPAAMFWCCRLLKKFAAKTASLQAKPEAREALAKRRFANDLFARLMFRTGCITLAVTVVVIGLLHLFELSFPIFGTALIGVQLCAFFIPIFVVQNTLGNPDFVVPDIYTDSSDKSDSSGK